MSHRTGLPIVVAIFVLALAVVASSSSAQTIMRKPNEGRPSTLEASSGQVPREGPDPDGPYSLTVRVYVMPFDTNRSTVPGEGAHLLFTDRTGRRLGRDPATSALHDEIPDGRYEPVINPNPTMPVGPRGLAGNGIALRAPAEGRYELQVIGADHAAYEYIVQAWDRAGRPRWTRFGRRATEPGAVDRYELTYSLSLTPPIWIAEKRDHSLLTVFLHGVRQGRSESAAVGELVLADPRGRRLGVSPLTMATYKEIPRAYYGAASNEGSELGVPKPADGVYTLDVVGTAVGRYDLEFHPSGRMGDPLSSLQLAELPIRPATVHRYALSYSASEGSFHVSGGFLGGDSKVDEAKGFSTYAHPITAETRLRAGQITFPLLIFYGSRIFPETLRALLNGADVTKLFTPTPRATRWSCSSSGPARTRSASQCKAEHRRARQPPTPIGSSSSFDAATASRTFRESLVDLPLPRRPRHNPVPSIPRSSGRPGRIAAAVLNSSRRAFRPSPRST